MQLGDFKIPRHTVLIKRITPPSKKSESLINNHFKGGAVLVYHGYLLNTDPLCEKQTSRQGTTYQLNV